MSTMTNNYENLWVCSAHWCITRCLKQTRTRPKKKTAESAGNISTMKQNRNIHKRHFASASFKKMASVVQA